MRNDVVLNIHSQSVEAGNFRFIIPQEIHKMGRSLKHGSRVFLIQGGPAATKGWRDFQETFNVDGPEAARLVSWYYNLLVQLYLNGLSTEDVQKILLSEPTSYLPRDFWEATGKPKNPAFILVSSGARAILGAHARVTEERLEWKLEPRYAGLFTSPSFASRASHVCSVAMGVDNSGTTTEQLFSSVASGDPLLPRSHRSFSG